MDSSPFLQTWETGAIFSSLTGALCHNQREFLRTAARLPSCGSREDTQMQPPLSGTEPPSRKTVLLLDSNAERRSLRQKVLGLHGIEVVGASDSAEANSIWQRDRYDLVLIDIRRDYHGSLARRDEIKKENPKQLVAFLVGQPEYVNLEPGPNSYVADEPGAEWSDSFSRAVRQACSSLPQKNAVEEVGFQSAVARKVKGLPRKKALVAGPADNSRDEMIYDPREDSGSLSTTAAAPQDGLRDDASTEREDT
jgi:CheY-like chemotaxis protein